MTHSYRIVLLGKSHAMPTLVHYACHLAISLTRQGEPLTLVYMLATLSIATYVWGAAAAS